ncbi:unnamed protein product [Urochloa humidicola]
MDASLSSAPSSLVPEPPLQIVIFPWLAYGHMLPNLELAERLASRGHRVSFVSTPANIARLPAPRGVDFVPLRLPRVEGMVDGAENTTDAPDLRALFVAFDGLVAPFAEFVAARCADAATRPDWIIVDPFLHFATAAAAEHGVPCVMLLPSAPFLAAMACGARHRAELTAASVFEQPTLQAGPPAGMGKHEWQWISGLHGPIGASGVSFARRCILTLEKCAFTAMRSCPEWEREGFPLAAALLGKPVVPLGLLAPSPDGNRAASVNSEHATVRWLDAQPPSSVLYVALGSIVSLSVLQVHELVLGLELAGTRFLLVLHKPGGDPDTDALPAGFRERTLGRGLVTVEWVPQISILGHAAVGAFLTHCGRNSLAEGLRHGQPLILLPIFVDQWTNATFMEGRKVGVRVARDDDDGSFDRHGIAGAVRAVMIDQDARKVFVENAKKMQGIVADKGLQERYTGEFILHLRSYTNAGYCSISSCKT